MNYQQTTQIPNIIFDTYLTQLSFSELKILLYIVRQTYGWKQKNGKRKNRDRITYGQFRSKTGLSRRIISQTIQSLIVKHLISATDYYGNKLHTPQKRKGKVSIYYAPSIQTCAKRSTNLGNQKHIPMQNMVHNKTNSTKLTRQKSFEKVTRQSDYERVQELLQAR